MAYQTQERKASQLEVGDRVLRDGQAWYVSGYSGSADGSRDVEYRVHRFAPDSIVQTYGADDPVEVITGGFADRPDFTSDNRRGLIRQAVRGWLGPSGRPGPR